MDHIFNELLALTRAGLMDVPLETDRKRNKYQKILKGSREKYNSFSDPLLKFATVILNHQMKLRSSNSLMGS